MFRWARLIAVWGLGAAAALTTILWLIPVENESFDIAIADEYPRKNVYIDWKRQFWHLRAFPPEVMIVPHHFAFHASWHTWKGGMDALSISYRPTVEKADGSIFHWGLGDFRAGADYITLDAPSITLRNYGMDVPIWFVVAVLWLWPVVVFVRGPVRRRHRRRRGLCPQCAYELTANTSGACPECGTKITRQSRSALACQAPT